MSVGPDLRLRARDRQERIVRHGPTVRFDAHDFAEVTFQVLRTNREMLQLSLAQCHEQRAIAREYQARAEVSSALHRGHLAEYHFDFGQLCVAQLCPGDGGAVATLAGLGEREIDSSCL